jgi:solute carrier family 41
MFQHWEVFRVVSEVFILVPALLGLKGNLEMTLASRLSTQANLGYMDTPKQQWSLIVGNLSLIQVLKK